MLRCIRPISCTALSLTLWLATVSNPAAAQLGTATISGIVTDASGAVIVGATVGAVNKGTNFRRQTISNGQGQYNLPGLAPGSYNASVELKGFRRAELDNITLQIDQNVRLNVALEVGQVTETVAITAEAH